LASRQLIDQSEDRTSRIKEEMVTVREALGKVRLQKDVLESEKQETGKSDLKLCFALQFIFYFIINK
jgi:hypothetical protein